MDVVGISLGINHYIMYQGIPVCPRLFRKETKTFIIRYKTCVGTLCMHLYINECGNILQEGVIIIEK